MVRLGRALNECKSRAEADHVAEVIVSQVSLVVALYLSTIALLMLHTFQDVSNSLWKRQVIVACYADKLWHPELSQ